MAVAGTLVIALAACMSDALAHELDVARSAAREAGAAIMRFYGHADCAVRTKPDQSPVTAADEAANECLEKRIRAAFPDDGFLSEESPDDGARFGKRRVGSSTRSTARVTSWRRPATSACSSV